MAPLGLQQRHLEGRTRNLLFKRAGLSSSVELRAWGQQRAGPCVAARFPSCRVGAMWSALHGPGRAKDSARTRGWLLRKLPSRWVGGRGKVCCRRLAGRSQKPERAEGVQLVNAIYTMYNWLSVHSAGSVLTRSRRLGREQGTVGKGGQACPTPSWHSRGKGEEVPMAPPDTKNVERIL